MWETKVIHKAKTLFSSAQISFMKIFPVRVSIFILLVFSFTKSFSQQTFPVNGVADQRHTTYAFIHAKIFIDYKTSVDSAVMLVRDGKILEAGKNIAVPSDAFIIDLKGKYIYPSF